MATGPNLASHWIQAHGGTGDVMNQKVTDGPCARARNRAMGS